MLDSLDPFEAFFANYPADIQGISRTLRAMVKSTMPQAHEILYARHNHIGYAFTESMADRICYICPMQNYVRLGFMFGSHLSNPHHMLVGEGKRLRHVKVRTTQEANNPALKQLVEEAWAEILATHHSQIL